MPPLDFLREPTWQRLTAALLHFLWQGFALGVLLHLLLPFLSTRSAGTRYAVCVGALLVMAACVPVTFCLVPSPAGPIAGAMNGLPLTPLGVGENGAAAPPTPGPSVTGGRTEPDGRGAWPLLVTGSLRSAQPYLLSAWLLGALLLSSRLLFGLVSIPRLLMGRAPVGTDLAGRVTGLSGALGLPPKIPVFASRRVGEAVVFGFVRPMILVPLSWLAEMTPDVLEAVLAHELAHIRRCDLWVNLFQRIVETLLFYHPTVWWLSRRIRLEREICCDDLAVAATGRRVDYATALELAGRKRVSPATVPFESVSGGGRMALLDRIQHVLGLLPERNRIAWGPVGLGAVATVLLLVICLAHGAGPAATMKPGTGRAPAEPDGLAQQLGQNPDSPGLARGAASPGGNLRFTIHCGGGLFKVGDEVPIELAITNGSPEDLEYWDYPDGSGVHDGPLAFAAFDQDGRAVPGSGAATSDARQEQATPRAVLRAGQSWARTVALNRWAFITQAGTYRVVGTLQCRTTSRGHPTMREVRSPPITITVHPRSPHERAEHIQTLRRSLSAAQGQTASNELAWKLVYACDPWLVPSVSEDIRMSDRPADEDSARERPKSVANLHKSITLKKPYPAPAQGRKANELTILDAVAIICGQVGVPFLSERSLGEAEPMCLRMVSPELAGLPAAKALEQLLQPQGLSYEVDEEGLYLKPAKATRWEQNMRRKVALRKPYEARYPGAPRDHLSVQSAVSMICAQADIPFQGEKSFHATDPFCRQWVSPEFQDLRVRAALERILGPVGLRYGVDDNGVYLRRGPTAGQTQEAALENLKRRVTLKKPYAVRFQGKEVTELPVFGATILICQQAGISFNFDRSLNEGDPMCMRMVSPEFADVPASKALGELLGPQELTYEIDDDGLFLKPIAAARWEPNLRRRVALRQPYDPRCQPSPRGQLSVQHAVAAVCGQAGIPYDWERSYKATDPLCRNWVTPEFQDLGVRTALERILTPVGLAYGIDAKGVYLKLKQRPGSPKAEPKAAVRKGQVIFGAPPAGLQPADTLTRQERAENFETLAEAIGKYYAMFRIKSIDWGEVVGRYRKNLDKAGTTEEFYFFLFQLVNELRDTHSWLQNWRPTVLAWRPEAAIEPFGDRAYVTSVPARSEPQQKGVEIGSEILAVDGAAVADRLKQIETQLKNLSSQRAFKREAFASLLAGDRGTEVKVKLRSPKGNVYEVVLPRTVARMLAPAPSYAFQVQKHRFVHHGTHPSGFGYVRILSFDGREEIADEFDKALEGLRETPGLVVDIRDNPGGFGNAQPRMVGRFIRQRTLVAVAFQASEPAPAELVRRETYFAPTGPWQYLKPVVLLVNENTGSAADLFACYLRSTGRVVTVGMTTHGNLSGTGAHVVLPCNLVVRISNGYVCDARGTPIEGRGNEPDVAVEPTISDFLNGQDVILEKAVSLLEKTPPVTGGKPGAARPRGTPGAARSARTRGHKPTLATEGA